MAVIRLVIDRNIVDLRHDALGPQRVVDLLPPVYMHDEQMVGGQIAVRRAEAPRWRSGELPEVSLRYGAAALQELRELFKLRDAERRADVRHAVVEAQHLLLVVPASVRLLLENLIVLCDAVRGEELHPLPELLVVGKGHSALAGGNGLHRMEAEHGDVAVAARSDHLSPVLGAERVAAVLDYPEVVERRELRDLLHVAGKPAQMHYRHYIGELMIARRGLERCRERRG